MNKFTSQYQEGQLSDLSRLAESELGDRRGRQVRPQAVGQAPFRLRHSEPSTTMSTAHHQECPPHDDRVIMRMTETTPAPPIHGWCGEEVCR